MTSSLEPANVQVAVEKFHGAGVELTIASSRCGPNANKYAEHPYAFAMDRESAGGFVACLCDGAGDWGEGDAASRVAAPEAAKVCAQDLANVPDALRRALAHAHERVAAYPADPEFGASCSAALLAITHSTLAVGWAGGVEVLVVRRGTLHHRTTPHLLWRDLVALGQLTLEQVADFPHNDVTTRALGAAARQDPKDIPEIAGPWPLESGDLILLCSERVRRNLSESEILACANARSDSAAEIVRALVVATSAKKHFELCAIAIRVDRALSS